MFLFAIWLVCCSVKITGTKLSGKTGKLLKTPKLNGQPLAGTQYNVAIDGGEKTVWGKDSRFHKKFVTKVVQIDGKDLVFVTGGLRFAHPELIAVGAQRSPLCDLFSGTALVDLPVFLKLALKALEMYIGRSPINKPR